MTYGTQCMDSCMYLKKWIIIVSIRESPILYIMYDCECYITYEALVFMVFLHNICDMIGSNGILKYDNYSHVALKAL